MAQQKAKLDILDIPLDKDFALEPPRPRIRRRPETEKVKRPWYRNRWVIAGGIGTGFLGILAAAVLFVWNPRNGAGRPGRRFPVPSGCPPGPPRRRPWSRSTTST
jgi:hypothetical protein